MLKSFIKLLVTVVLVVFAVSKIDYIELTNVLKRMDPFYFLTALLILFILSIIQARRWQIILAAAGKPSSRLGAWQNVLIGLFYNQTLPSSIGGDAVRIYCAKSIGIGLSFRSIIIDRICALFTLSVACIGITIGLHLQSIDLPYKNLLIVAEFAAILFVVLLFKGEEFLNLFNVSKYFGKEVILQFCQLFKKLCCDRKRVFFAIFMSLIIHIFVSLSAVLLFIGMGSDESPIILGAVFALVSLFANIPISFGGWGIREGLSLTLFSSVTVQQEMAFAVSILFGVLMMMVGGIGGIIWLLTNQKSKELVV